MDRSVVTAPRIVERLLSLLWLVALAAIVALAIWSHVTTLVVVAGGSMEPVVPRGSLIQPRLIAPAAIAVGDVVTVRVDSGVLVTHRVVRIVGLPAGRHLELRGDANDHPDPVLIPAGRVVGRVDYVVPGAGYVLSMLASWTGVVAIVALFAAALIGLSLLEEAVAAPLTAAGQPADRAHAPH
jgi:signal peptidase